MKIIITENKLNEFINKFIGDYIRGSYVRYRNDGFLIYEDSDEDPNDWASHDSVVLEHDSEDGRLLIRYRLVKTISDMFGLTLTDARIRIKDWFENENGLIVKFVESDKIGGKLYFNNDNEDTNN
jgi:hypothetical protein